MKPFISMITLGVANFPRSLSFYRDGLAFPLHEFINDHIAFFTLNGAWLAVHPVDMLAADAGMAVDVSTGFRGVTIAHNVASSKEVDEVMHQAERAGARISTPPRKTDWGGYSGTFLDPDGHAWEVAFNPGFTPGE